MKEKRDKNGGKGRGCEPRIEVIVQNAKTNKTSGRSRGGGGGGGQAGGVWLVDVNQEWKLL